METGFSLKDHLFNPPKIAKLAQEIQQVYPAFNANAFQEAVVVQFPILELKQRITWIANCLRNSLPEDYAKALPILLAALPEPCNPDLSDDDFGDFIYASFNEFIALYGCTETHLEISLSAIEEVTMRFSAEDAIRRFINAFPEQTLEKLKQWAIHPHYHVRRLVSEGTRPKLPWASKINYTPEWYLPLLDTLHADRSRYVTRSIANHLNDVSKNDPDAVIQRLADWKALSTQDPQELAYMTRHSLRTLVKQGHSSALSLLGFSADTQISASLTLHKTSLSIGETLPFTISLEAKTSGKVIVDFVMTFQGKNGRVSEKVFKLKTVILSQGEIVSFTKNYAFKADMTTRTFYPGNHQIQLQVNGERLAPEHFLLK